MPWSVPDDALSGRDASNINNRTIRYFFCPVSSDARNSGTVFKTDLGIS